jgi:hypothetical protein
MTRNVKIELPISDAVSKSRAAPTQTSATAKLHAGIAHETSRNSPRLSPAERGRVLL